MLPRFSGRDSPGSQPRTLAWWGGNGAAGRDSGRTQHEMPVDAELLEILACPNCKTPVKLVNNGSGLKCATCNRVYPIKDDIPVMLIDEATVEP